MKKNGKISLGFTEKLFEPGAHVCQIINDDQERQDAIISYLINGLKDGERVACFSDHFPKDEIKSELEGIDKSFDQLCSDDSLISKTTGEVYFHEGRFDPDRMLGLLENYYNEAMAKDYPNARVIGEMTAEVEKVPGGERLFEYECRVSMLVRRVPVTAVCQYDAKQFDGATIMDVLKVHPFMIIRGEVIHNPFFIPPEEYLREHGFGCECH